MDDPTLTKVSAKTAAPSAAGGSPRLVMIEGDRVGATWTVRGTMTIGRAPDATVVLDDPQISRVHARLIAAGSSDFVLEDAGSRNGTIVNGVPVRVHPLAFGDRIQLGTGTVLLFTHHDPLEERLRQKQRLETLGRIGAGMAHDFNNILGAAMGAADYLRELPPGTPLSDEEVRSCLEDLAAAHARAAELAAMLLALGRAEAPDLGRVELSRVCHDVLQLVRRSSSQSVQIEASIEPAVQGIGDRTLLHQALLNLCVNARDAMPRGGTLRVSLRREREDLVVLEVSDTGAGMEDETLRRAFEPFFTTRPGKGSGLGLAIVAHAVRVHGGKVDVASVLRTGTTFRIELPFRGGASSPTPAPAAHAPSGTVDANPRAGRILLADDDEGARRALARLLKRFGYDVVDVPDGVAALTAYARERADLVLCDLDMPGADGVETVRRLRHLDPAVRVLFVTGQSPGTSAAAVDRAGALGVLGKPCGALELRAAVSSALRGEPLD